jgi:hypothetical protein
MLDQKRVRPRRVVNFEHLLSVAQRMPAMAHYITIRDLVELPRLDRYDELVLKAMTVDRDLANALAMYYFTPDSRPCVLDSTTTPQIICALLDPYCEQYELDINGKFWYKGGAGPYDAPREDYVSGWEETPTTTDSDGDDDDNMNADE